jgi:L-2-hydroxyglutarate oxidase LhgO
VGAVEQLDALVIGAGVIGLATARALALAGREVVVLEAEKAFGLHTSSRNSEVIHAGIYYPNGSLKARSCVAGKAALYDYCQRNAVQFRRLGKLIVATSDQEVPVLRQLHDLARSNGVDDLCWVDRSGVAALEPAVTAVCGLFSASTGIVDSHGLMRALRADAVRAGAHAIMSSRVVEGRVGVRGIELDIDGAESLTLSCRTVVNAAGLGAQQVARSIRGLRSETIPPQFLAKGHYFALAGRAPFSHLVYPTPVPGGQGIHVTLDLAEQCRFGPDVCWVDTVDYAFDASRAGAFYAAIRRYYPDLADGALVPGYTGIRPKLAPPTAPAQDFLVHGPREHGVPGLVNLYGIESPGLTACLALAEHAVALLA